MSSSAVAAASASKPVEKPQTAHQPKTKYAFDVEKPLKNGYLKKRGRVTNKMSERFFVLYPNFLVYYDKSADWGRDKTAGNLTTRKDAVKLTGATARVATSNDTSGSDFRFPFILEAPDSANKKNSYLLDTTSGEERQGWIEAIMNNKK